MQQHAREGIAIALSAREHSQRLENVIVGEEKASQQVAKLGSGGARRDLFQIVKHPTRGGEQLVLILCEIIGLGVMPERVLACRQRFAAVEHADQRRFSSAVWAHKGNSISTIDHEIHVAENFLRVITFCNRFELSNDAPAGLGLRKMEMDRLLFWWNLDALHALEFLDATLHLLSLGGLIAKAIDEGFELLDLCALVAVCRFELRFALLALHQILLVIPRIELNALVPDFDRFLHGYVEEVPVVR